MKDLTKVAGLSIFGVTLGVLAFLIIKEPYTEGAGDVVSIDNVRGYKLIHTTVGDYFVSQTKPFNRLHKGLVIRERIGWFDLCTSNMAICGEIKDGVEE